jgi:hypothetical protein
MADDEVEVRVHKNCYATFTVKAGPRPQMEKAVEEKLRTDNEIPWIDGPEGVDAEVIPPIGKSWNIRKRF